MNMAEILSGEFRPRSQCQACLSLIYAKSEDEAQAILRLHISLTHPEVKRAVEKFLAGEDHVT